MGLGILVNNCKQCQMWCSGGFARCWACWGDFGAGKFIFRCSRVSYTHLGCFGAPGGAGASAKSLTMHSRSPAFQIRQVVPRGRIHSWARFCMVENLYYSRYNVFTCNVLFYKCLGR